MSDLLGLPWDVLRVPRLKLKVPHIQLPGPMTVFALFLLSYFLVLSGIMYDVIQDPTPPSIGQVAGPDGKPRPVVFMAGRVNGQFIIEGLSAGFMFILGGVGVILLDVAADKSVSSNHGFFALILSVAFVISAYVMTVLFLRMKLPGYLVSGSA